MTAVIRNSSQLTDADRAAMAAYIAPAGRRAA